MKDLIDDINDTIRELKALSLRLKVKPLINPSTDYKTTRRLVLEETKNVLGVVEEIAKGAYPEIKKLVEAWVANQKKRKQAIDETEEDEELQRELELLDLDKEDILLLLAIAAAYRKRAGPVEETLRSRMAGTFEKTYQTSINSMLSSLNLTPSSFIVPGADTGKLNARFLDFAKPALSAVPGRLAASLGDIIQEMKAREVAARDIANRILSRLKPAGEDWSRLSYQFERIARTELSAAAHMAKLEAFQAAGVQQVMYVTAGDSRVCRRCLKFEGMIFQASDPEIKDLIPMHPNCRCTIVPVASRDANWLQLPRR